MRELGLRPRPPHAARHTVVHPYELDGTMLNRWPGQAAAGSMPAFCLQAPASVAQPTIIVKMRRTFERPGDPPKSP